MDKYLFLLCVLALQLGTWSVRASADGRADWVELFAAFAAAGLGFRAARARPLAWLAAGVAFAAALLTFNRPASPGLPRVLTPVTPEGLHLLPCLAAILVLAPSLYAARLLPAGGGRARARVALVVGVALATAATVALVLGDLATLILVALPLAGVLGLYVRRPAWALATVVVSLAVAALAPASVWEKTLGRLGPTWWMDGPFSGPDDTVGRMLWAIAAAGWTGRGGEAVPGDLRRWSDDAFVAFVTERHGVPALVPLAIVAMGCVFTSLRIAAQAPPWRPEARVVPVAVVLSTLVPTAWIAAAATAVGPLMGISSPLVYQGGANLCLAAFFTGLVLATPRDRRGADDPGALSTSAFGWVFAATGGLTLAALAPFLVLGGPLRDRLTALPTVTCSARTATGHANPRLERLAERLGRVDVVDRRGEALATDARIDGDATGDRIQPFGAALDPLVGSAAAVGSAEAWRTQNASYPKTEVTTRCGQAVSVRDYSALVPVLHGTLPLEVARDARPPVRSTIDGALTQAVHARLEEIVATEQTLGGMVIVLDQAGHPLVEASVVAQPDAAGPRRVEVGPRGAGVNLAEQMPLPVGSPVKPLVDLGAISLGFPRSYRFGCRALQGEGSSGAVRITRGGESTTLHDHEHARPHGDIGFTEALGRSCNGFHGEVGAWLGADRLTALFTRFGFAQPTVAPGLFHETRAAIGQDAVEATPRQIADAMTVFLNDGTRVHCDTWFLEGSTPACVRNDLFSASDTHFIANGLDAVLAFGGTGRRAAVPGARVAGKTGTADATLNGERVTIAWWAGLVETDEDAWIIVVALPGSHSATGGQLAAPFAAEIGAMLVSDDATTGRPSQRPT